MEEKTHSKPGSDTVRDQARAISRSNIAELQSTHTMRRRVLFALAIPMAWFFMNNYLEAPRGFNMALFWPVFLLVTLWYFNGQTLKKDPAAWLTIAAAGAGSWHSAMYAAEEMSALNFLALPLLSVFCLLTATRKNPDISAGTYSRTLDTLIIKPFLSLIYLIPFLSLPGGTSKSQTHDRKLLKEVALGLLIAGPLVFFLLILLSNADAGFSTLVNGFLDGFLLNFTLTNAMANIARTAIGIFYFLGIVMGIQLNRQKEDLRTSIPRTQSPIVSLIVLWSVNTLYLIFTATQFRSLYFPKTALTSMDQGLAQYAREGFFYLLMVIGINLFLLWIISSITQRKKSFLLIFRLGYILMGLFTANMILSSFYKMHLYEQEYGFTYMRLFVKFALIFFSIGLLITALFLMGKLKNLLKALTLTALSLYIVLNLLNLDGIIAAKAARIYETNGRLDVPYLSSLSADAYPSLKKSFHFDSTSDPQIIHLKKAYTDHLYSEISHIRSSSQPLATTLSELRVKP